MKNKIDDKELLKSKEILLKDRKRQEEKWEKAKKANNDKKSRK